MKKDIPLKHSVSDIPVVILAGGKGIRLGKGGEVIPKTMVEVNGKPMLFYVLNHYLTAGFKRFIICAGLGIELIECYLYNDFPDGDIKVLNTGIDNMTGSRIAQTRGLIENDIFCMTYGDSLSDVDVQSVIACHLKWQARVTLLAVHNPTRFKILGLMEDEHVIKGFSDKPVLQKDYINGGFYVLNRSVFDADSISEAADCVFEEDVLNELAAEGKLCAYRYEGFWQPLDNERDSCKISEYLSR